MLKDVPNREQKCPQLGTFIFAVRDFFFLS